MMTKHDCEVCCGRGKIRVPVYGRVMAFDPLAAETMTESSREYPCPECSEVVPVERLAVTAERRFIFSEPENDPQFMEAMKRQMAHALIDGLLEKDLVKFERGPTDTTQMRFEMRMTTAVVSPHQVATLQERVAEHQEALAREVMAEASRQISNWESHYTGTEGHIQKAQAVDSVREALRTVLSARAKWRAA